MGGMFPAIVLSCLILGHVASCWAEKPAATGLPDGFVYVEEVIPGIRADIRYISDRNFVGSPVDGYIKPKLILTKEAAEALRKVEKDLNRFGLALKIFDAYRPQRAVDHFSRWAGDLKDTRTKAEYYPRVEKSELFKQGYIAERSGHSRGSTVDLTIVCKDERSVERELDMGTPFDFFGPESWPESALVTPVQRAHRMLLAEVMEKHGFAPFSKEWWHFTLKNEPFPKTYFDFPIQ